MSLLGTYDDHDYGVNDGDKTYQYREESKQYLLDFLNVSHDDIRRSPANEGVYGVQYIEHSLKSGRTFKTAIITLDIR